MINILWTNTFYSVYLCSPAISQTLCPEEAKGEKGMEEERKDSDF